ncbi:hypothetical protein AQUCO_02500124v1 [Aquilegia coerulea]|uniref:Uncharacterized protein n=2 Tax=Aquilegia coerulea TaxID=218851 RepID=A0A2G5D9K6_AQUCA|nr:hypothetical protein AQUCO_02500124v1 [Aquilegia coerulea]
MNPNSSNNNLSSSSSPNPIIQEWEAKARVWLSALPNHTNVTMNQVEAWINSEQVPLPEQLKSLSLYQLYEKILSLSQNQNNQIIIAPSQEEKASAHHPARFQRTDQWIPVYAWLEALDKNEVVKSKEITDWLSENPSVKEKLYARHSRYHLMHYIQKCHMKILKRQGKLQKAAGSMSGDRLVPQAAKPPAAKVPTRDHNNGVLTVVVPNSGTPSTNLLKNNDASTIAKRDDAFSRYQLFTELENQLSTLLSKQDK